MTPRDFAYWLQGFFEISDAKSLGEKEIAMIKEHLGLVFTKVTGDEAKTLTASSLGSYSHPGVGGFTFC